MLLDTIVTAFRAGATAEEIAAYVSQRQTEAAALQKEVEQSFDPVGVRARLIARRSGEHSDQ